jgi:phage shock protein E
MRSFRFPCRPVVLLAFLAAACGASGGGVDATSAETTDVTTDVTTTDLPAADVPGIDLPPAESSTDPGTDPGPASLGMVSVQQLHDELPTKDFLLVNVHIPDEGEIPGTDVHIAFDEVDDLVAYIGTDLDRDVTVYCMTNGMSTLAGNDLVSRGYRAIRYVDGGMSGWKKAGFTLDPYP